MKVDYYAKFSEKVESPEDFELLKTKEGRAELAEVLRNVTGADEVSITRIVASEEAEV